MRKQSGFTLVELLVVIAIIGILMGIAVPAIFGVVETAKSTKQRLEIGGIEQAIERYQEKYGDYPPDFSDWTIVERHYRKIFPRIAATELNLLQRLTDLDPSNDLEIGAAAGTHDSSGWGVSGNDVELSFGMDRAEVLVWTLGGYSSNPILPFSGAGGPLESVAIDAANGTQQFQVNLDRDNPLYEFDKTRLDVGIPDKDSPISAVNFYRSTSGKPDLFPHYSAHDDGVPFVYFDSRTYAHRDSTQGYNRYVNSLVAAGRDSVRPYLSDLKTTDNSLNFVNPNSFQVVAPGVDGLFGFASFTGSLAILPNAVSNIPNESLYFIYPTGKVMSIRVRRGRIFMTPSGNFSRYQEPEGFGLADNPQQDNLTNFADGKLIDELEE